MKLNLQNLEKYDELEREEKFKKKKKSDSKRDLPKVSSQMEESKE